VVREGRQGVIILEQVLIWSELVSRFELARLHDRPLRPQDIVELKQAEKLAKMFLEWDIDPDTQDVKDVLKNMIEVCLGSEDDYQGEGEIQDVKAEKDTLEVQEMIDWYCAE
jgi:DNA mismatch repair protein MSH5